MDSVQLCHLYRSPGHNYCGHHGRPASEHPILSCDEIHCVAGRGIEGDRFFDYRRDYKGQITFFAAEVFDLMCERFPIQGLAPSAVRRNVITRGLDLNSLIGEEFVLQGIRFLGTGECKPCYWMNSAVHPEAEAFLKGRGGLRAKILDSGTLRRSDVAALSALSAPAAR